MRCKKRENTGAGVQCLAASIDEFVRSGRARRENGRVAAVNGAGETDGMMGAGEVRHCRTLRSGEPGRERRPGWPKLGSPSARHLPPAVGDSGVNSASARGE